MFCAPLPPKYDDALMGGVNLATQLIGGLFKCDTSLREVKLTVEEEEDNDKRKTRRGWNAGKVYSDSGRGGGGVGGGLATTSWTASYTSWCRNCKLNINCTCGKINCWKRCRH